MLLLARVVVGRRIEPADSRLQCHAVVVGLLQRRALLTFAVVLTVTVHDRFASSLYAIGKFPVFSSYNAFSERHVLRSTIEIALRLSVSPSVCMCHLHISETVQDRNILQCNTIVTYIHPTQLFRMTLSKTLSDFENCQRYGSR